MSGFIDTNLLVYAVNQDSEHHVKAREFLETLLQGPDSTYVSWANLYEFLRVVTHPKVFPRPLSWKQTIEFLKILIAAPGVVILQEGGEHARLLGEILASLRNPQGNIMHDVHIATLLKEHAVRTIFTHDTDFRLFPFLKVVDPLA